MSKVRPEKKKTRNSITMNAWIDTSALVKLYIEEEGTDRAIEAVPDTDRSRAVILDLALLEARSAIRRRQREKGGISRADADRALRHLEEDAASIFEVQLSNAPVLREAARLIDRHPLRAYDATQLAGCRLVSRFAPDAWKFVCADADLCDVAALEGLAVENPAIP